MPVMAARSGMPISREPYYSQYSHSPGVTQTCRRMGRLGRAQSEFTNL